MSLQLDVNHDEFISKRELKKYIKEHPHGKLPKNLAKNIMDVSDTNLDGRLDFDEFCVMDTKYKWLFTWYIRRYVEIGKIHHSKPFDSKTVE